MMCCEDLVDDVTPEEEEAYRQLQREQDALWYEVGERVYFPLVLGDHPFEDEDLGVNGPVYRG